MNHRNVIDMSAHFAQLQQKNASPLPAKRNAERVFGAVLSILETAAATAMALCVCVCTLLFFTML